MEWDFIIEWLFSIICAAIKISNKVHTVHVKYWHSNKCHVHFISIRRISSSSYHGISISYNCSWPISHLVVFSLLQTEKNLKNVYCFRSLPYYHANHLGLSQHHCSNVIPWFETHWYTSDENNIYKRSKAIICSNMWIAWGRNHNNKRNRNCARDCRGRYRRNTV